MQEKKEMKKTDKNIFKKTNNRRIKNNNFKKGLNFGRFGIWRKSRRSF
jgi:hypothetical protein